MQSETRTCQNCKKDFVIEQEDFNFYEKIIKVPAPTFCPECRLMRRLSWRNERILYKRKCDVKNHNEYIISIYSGDFKFPVYDSKYWLSDNWDPSSYGLDYNYSVNFFVQLNNLMNHVPVRPMFNINSVKSEYCNCVFEEKNCYLDFASDFNEDTAYLYHSIQNKNSFDMLGSRKNEICYELVDCDGCYESERLVLSEGCIDCKYCYDCRNCQNCVGCFGLRNAKYFIFNKKYSPDDFKDKLKELNLQNESGSNNFNKKFKELILKYPRRFSNSKHTVQSFGDYMKDAKNCKNCFDVEGPSENLKYVIYGVTNMKDSFDMYAIGVNVQNSYEMMGGGSNTSFSIFSSYIIESHNVHYCLHLNNCQNCFACVGLRNKQYCILNKQYTKEQYEELVPKIIQHMNDMPYIDSKGRIYKYGEFFPPELSPFCYNETIAQEYFPLTKEQALEQGYKWKDREERNYKIDIKSEDIPDDIKDVDETILGKVIECEHKGECNEQCTEAFKIIESELQFYKRMNLPIPHLCPNCRHYQRLKQRNPLKLWHRQCMCDKENHNHKGRCSTEFETSYSPDRPEIIYCEECYKREVY